MSDVSAPQVVSATSPRDHKFGDLDLLVLGGGISGLTLAWEILKHRPEWRIQVLEADQHPGGKVGSEWIEGCLCERGPHGFMTNVPYTRDLALGLGLGPRLIQASSGVSHRYLWSQGALRMLPARPGQFLASDLLGFRGKLRALMEPMIPRGNLDRDTSVHDFVSMRVGPEAAEVLAAPMVLGIFGGDSHKISFRAAFPEIAALQADHGSLTRGMMARRRKSRNRRSKPVLTSFDQGLEVLIQELADRLAPRVQTGTMVTGLKPTGGIFQVTAGDDPPKNFTAKRVAVAVPAHVAQGLLQGEYPQLAGYVGEVPYVGMAVVNMIYDRKQVNHPLDGFGFLVPPGQGLKIIGSIWTGSVFPEHVTGDKVAISAMMGGAFDPESPLLPEDKIINMVHGDLSRTLGVTGRSPRAARVYRHPKGIPQYELGHLDRISAIRTELTRIPGLFLTGNAYLGVGMNDCVRSAGILAREICGVPLDSGVTNPRPEGVS